MAALICKTWGVMWLWRIFLPIKTYKILNYDQCCRAYTLQGIMPPFCWMWWSSRSPGDKQVGWLPQVCMGRRWSKSKVWLTNVHTCTHTNTQEDWWAMTEPPSPNGNMLETNSVYQCGGGERPRAWPCPEQLPVDSRNLLLSTVLLTMYTGGLPMSWAGEVRWDGGTGDWKGWVLTEMHEKHFECTSCMTDSAAQGQGWSEPLF